MKRISTYVFILVLITIISCKKEHCIDFGFDSSFDKNASELVIADISHNTKYVYLNGFISLEEGELDISLLNPKGVAVYSNRLVAPIELRINETFDAGSGYWKLKYKSIEGIGEIDLHLH